MEEIWLNVSDYIGLYQVSNWGRVKSLERDVVEMSKLGKEYVRRCKEKILRPIPNRGYLMVILCKNGVLEGKYIHQIVAEAFIPNPNNYDVVHHINHDQTDNRIENLEWISKEEHDRLHADERAKVVYQYTKDGLLVNVWKSTHEAARQLGFDQSTISTCCLGKRKTAYGYIWSYDHINA